MEYHEQIENANTLEAISELRRARPWRNESIAMILDALLNERKLRLTAEAATLTAEVARLNERAARLTAEAKSAGTFYDRIDQVFVSGTLPTLSTNFYESCCRSVPMEEEVAQKGKRGRATKKRAKPRQKREERQDQVEEETSDNSTTSGTEKYHCRTGNTTDAADLYQLTFVAARNENNSPATNDRQSRNSTHNKNREQIWKKSVVASSNAGTIAHLVPAAVEAANSYWFVTEFLFGVDANRSWSEVRRLIHGSNPRQSTANASSKIKGTGIKHLVTNKVLLASQTDYFDIAPCVMIVPIMSREDAIRWRGKGYPAIMLIDKYGEESKNDLRSVCNLTFFAHPDGQKAESGELLKATELLQNYTKAILFGQRERMPQECTFSLPDLGMLAFYPALPENHENLNVRKVFFDGNESFDGHPAPDPLLLVSKAVAVLQRRNGFTIVAAAEPQDEHSPSDQSVLAEEEFLRLREEAIVYPDPVGLDIVLSH